MEEQNLRLQEEAKRYVQSMGRWYKFFGILSIVGCAFMVIAAIVIGITGTALNSLMQTAEMEGVTMPAIPMGWMAVIYLISAGLMVPIIVYLLRGAKAAEEAVVSDDNEAAVRFLANSKSYWKYYGILTIVMIAFCILFVPIIAISAAAMAL